MDKNNTPYQWVKTLRWVNDWLVISD